MESTIIKELSEFRKDIDLDFIKIMIHYCQEKYPDNLDIIYVKNANIMIKSLYAIIRPFVDKDTRKKINDIDKAQNLIVLPPNKGQMAIKKKTIENKIPKLFSEDLFMCYFL